MRILEVAPQYIPEANGIAEVVSRVATGLVRRGHDVEVATRAFPGTPMESTLAGVKIHRFAISGNSVRGIVASSREVSRFRSLLRGQSWSVIHFHTAVSWTLDLMIDEIQSLPGKHVLTPHGARPDAAGYADYYRRLVVVYASFDRVTCQSESYGEIPFAMSHGLPKPIVIPNGIEPTEYGHVTTDYRRLWHIDERPFIINLSNHAPQKGHERLFELAGHLDKDAVLCNIGRSYPAAKWGLGRLGVRGGCYYACHLKALGKSSIQMRSLRDRSSNASALALANVFVLTSTWEASPLVILEAMASGLPWVSFDVGNVHEYPGGFIVSTVQEMADRVHELLRNPALASSLGCAGRDYVLQHNTWQKVIDEYEALFRELVPTVPVARVSLHDVPGEQPGEVTDG